MWFEVILWDSASFISRYLLNIRLWVFFEFFTLGCHFYLSIFWSLKVSFSAATFYLKLYFFWESLWNQQVRFFFFLKLYGTFPLEPTSFKLLNIYFNKFFSSQPINVYQDTMIFSTFFGDCIWGSQSLIVISSRKKLTLPTLTSMLRSYLGTNVFHSDLDFNWSSFKVDHISVLTQWLLCIKRLKVFSVV